MAKKQAQGGIMDLLNPNKQVTPTADTATPQETEQVLSRLKSPRGTTVRVCYNLNKELVTKANKIANYDRKNINEVFNEALEAYIKGWTPTPQEPPQL